MKQNFLPEASNAVDRIDGKAKVTGSARYAAEYKLDKGVYGVLVTSSIAKGRIKSINSKNASSAPGVLAVLTHLNRPQVPGWDKPADPKEASRVEGQEFRVFYDEKIYYNHQPVALVIAETLEKAVHAASLVKLTYVKAPHQTNIFAGHSQAIGPKREKNYSRGSQDGFDASAVSIDAEYTTPIQVHNPMEMHAATVSWKGADSLTNYNKTQAVKIAQSDLVKAFELKPDDIEVISPFVGGAFGSSSRIWPPEMAAILAAKLVGRPVTVMARRDQVFNMVGYRPASIQKMRVGADKDGTLKFISHQVIGSTSTYEEFTERITDPTKAFYKCDNLSTDYKLLPLDMSTPCWTRGPGETSGSFALESAMDELSYSLDLDPLALRLKNYADKDPQSGLPWSSNYLKECYQKAADRFGWEKRNKNPRSMKSGNWLLGMGMSGGIYKAERSEASARATLRIDGTLLVQSSVADVGPGSATIMAQIAADTFGAPLAQVEFQWGNSLYPKAPGQFGSHTTASVGSAVHDAIKSLQKRILELAVNSDATLAGSSGTDELFLKEGRIVNRISGRSLSYPDLLKQNNLFELQVTADSKSGSEKEQFSGKSFCAHFVEVLVHPATGVVKVNRVVTAVDAGKIINYKTAQSQVYGSIVWGIGIALMEEGILDHRFGRYVNNNLADYHVPVHADIANIEVIFIDKPDPILSPLGVKGLGEIGLVGFSAAVANAVYHATGKRIRSLPITADKLIENIL